MEMCIRDRLCAVSLHQLAALHAHGLGHHDDDAVALGGDDGIAVAYALAVLDAKDIPHPALEVVLTVCEEVRCV